jgi:hypothetical protein
MKIKFGDILAVELLNKLYMFVQIVYQIPQGNKDEIAKINPKSRLLDDRPFYNGFYIMNVYKQISKDMILQNKEIMFKGIMTMGRDIKKSKYTIIAHEKISVENVEFPETIQFYSKNSFSHLPSQIGYYLERGELKIFIKSEFDEELENGPKGGFKDHYSIGESVLYFQNRKNEMQRKYPEGFDVHKFLLHNDLRYYPELRDKVYKIIKEDPKQSYYEMALKYGFDLRKLYE